MKPYLSPRFLFSAVELTLIAAVLLNGETAVGEDLMQWEEIAVLPPATGEETQHGVAGAFAGVHGDVMLIAGGANFPQGLPWEGGPKVWWDSVFILERETSDEGVSYAWADEQGKLPAPSAYGVSIGLEDGVLCIGGCDARACSSEVILLQWDAEKRSVNVREFPPLPRPLAFMAGARVGDWILVAGGQESMEGGLPTKSFFGLDLSQRAAAGDAFRWVELPGWDGAERILPVAAGLGDQFYLWSGRKPDPDNSTIILTDAHAFDTATRSWSALGDVRIGEGDPLCIMAAPSCAAPGGDQVLVFGGADGVVMRMLEHNARKARSDNAEEAEAFGKFNVALLADHPGFGRSVLIFDPVTRGWSRLADFPEPCPVTTPAIVWDGAVVLPSGEIRPGVRSGRVWKGTIVKKAEAIP